jgi:hypothetical protein
MFRRIAFFLYLATSASGAFATNSVVLGRGVSNTGLMDLGCVDDLGMNCWFIWELDAKSTVSGPIVKGRVKALALQHVEATRTFVQSVELFVLSPISESDSLWATGARYTILALSPQRAGGSYCLWLDPNDLSVPVEKAKVTVDASGQYCFKRRLLDHNK